MDEQKQVNEFLRHYEAELKVSNRRWRRLRRFDFTAWAAADNSQDFLENQPYEDIACLELTIPQDRFRALVEDINWFDRVSDQCRQRGLYMNEEHLAQGVIDAAREEHRIRGEYPAVELAYQRYLTVLRLSGYSR